MERFQKIICLIIIPFICIFVLSQEKQPEFKPYNIETTYQKLKKNYPFISPIKPLKSSKIKCKENIVYKKIDDRRLKADIYIPKSKKSENHPVILLIHGGGWLTGSKENQNVMAQHLAINGYVAISVEYRLGLEAPYPAAVIDLKDTIRWIRENAKKYHINSNKIVLLGASSGAHLATLVGTTANSSIFGYDETVSDKVQAVINIDGIVSFIHPEAYKEGDMASIWLNGSRSENFKNWKEASPLEYVNKDTPPTLFINSNQPRFHAGRDEMIIKLNKYNIYNETHTVTNSPHSFWLVNPWFKTTLDCTIDFLKKVLK